MKDTFSSGHGAVSWSTTSADLLSKTFEEPDFKVELDGGLLSVAENQELSNFSFGRKVSPDTSVLSSRGGPSRGRGDSRHVTYRFPSNAVTSMSQVSGGSHQSRRTASTRSEVPQSARNPSSCGSWASKGIDRAVPSRPASTGNGSVRHGSCKSGYSASTCSKGSSGSFSRVKRIFETASNPLAAREDLGPVKDLDWILCSANQVDERKASLEVEPTGAKVIAAISRPGGGRKGRDGAAKANG